MGYYRDLNKINIEDYQEILQSMDLLPSWRILADNLEGNFDKIKQQQIDNLADLLKAISTKTKLSDFSCKSGLDEAYLTVLRRVIKGYLPKPNRIKDFPNTDGQQVQKLSSIGINNTRQLYDRVLTLADRKDLAQQTGVTLEQLHRLTSLTDLSRIKWVNHTFAFVLFEAGYRSAEEVATANPQEMYERIKELNAKRKFYKGHIGLNDMKRCVDAAKGLAFQIQFT